MKSRFSTAIDSETHAEFELLVAHRKYMKIKKGSNKPASIGDCLTEALQLLIANEKKKGWKPNMD